MSSVVGTLLITLVLVVVAAAAAPWHARGSEPDGLDTEGPLTQASENS